MPSDTLPGMVEAINAERRDAGLAALERHPALEEAAMVHARELAQRGVLSHTSRDGSTVGDRVRAAGYDWCFVAENVASGQRDISETVRGWMNSPGHRKNMLSERPVHAGGARVTAERPYWVAVFAAPC